MYSYEPYGPAPRGEGWADLRVIAEEADVEEWARLLHEGTDILSDSGSKPVRSQPGIMRRYIRARIR